VPTLSKGLFITAVLILGFGYIARAIPVLATTIQLDGGLAISGEFTGAVAGAGQGTGTPSNEGTITTVAVNNLSNSVEGNFSTLFAPTGGDPTSPSGEVTFQTLPTPAPCQGDALTCEAEPSAEGTFTTGVAPTDNPPPGGGDDGPPTGGGGGGSGGGSSGGGYGRRLPLPLVQNVAPNTCPVYLTKFIRLGANNDPGEVLKLQNFLRDFEGFTNVPLSGVYDLTTYNAVMVFQTRYVKDVLTPWGIDYPTGYVYITTSLAINNLYCERNPATTLDLRSRFFTPSIIEGVSTTTPTGAPTSTLPLVGVIEATTNTSRFLTAMLGAFNFFKQIPVWWWIVFLLVIILLLLLELVRERRRRRGNVTGADTEDKDIEYTEDDFGGFDITDETR